MREDERKGRVDEAGFVYNALAPTRREMAQASAEFGIVMATVTLALVTVAMTAID